MNIIEESFREKEEKEEQKKDNSKLVAKLLLAIIIILILMVIGLFMVTVYIKQSELVVYLDGVQNAKIKNLMIQQDDKIYFPIKDIASYLGYTSYNGQYSDKSEDVSKCYVQNDDEIANFVVNSIEVYKLNPNNSSEYEITKIDNAIKSIDGKLCIEANDMQKAFNVNYSYNGKNKMYIYTLNYLVEAYSANLLNSGYVVTNNKFTDKKSLLDGTLIVKKDDKYYGVIDLKGNIILEAKYDNISYLSNSGDFLVQSNGKVGIISKERETKVAVLYTSLKLIDSEKNLYLAEKDKKYGIIDSEGKIKIYIEYDQIGIDSTKFSQNGIKNKYILAENLIPVEKDKKWALFDKNGKQITDFIYDSLGYIASNNKNALNLLIISDYNVIVACKDGKYVLVNSEGNEICAAILEEIYMTISSGEKHYYMKFNDKVYNVIDFLEGRGLKTDSSNNNITENTTNTLE